MTKSMTEEARAGENWPPEAGQPVSFKSGDGWNTGVLREVRWGLVWRDFILDDGRVISEIRISGCPQPPVWRAASEVTQAERETAEERLASMAESGLDPREREQWFWAELNQYLAYTYLRFKRIAHRPSDADRRPDEFPERIKEVKRAVTGRLSELLEMKSGAQERESAAYSLGRLKDLEMALETVGSEGQRGFKK
jgi:hypothetical protein